MRKLLGLLLLSILFVGCSSDTEEPDTKELYEFFLAGIWKPAVFENFPTDVNSEDLGSVFTFNEDKTGSVRVIESIVDNKYTFSATYDIEKWEIKEYDSTGKDYVITFDVEKNVGGLPTKVSYLLLINHIEATMLYTTDLTTTKKTSYLKTKSIDLAE